MTESSVIVSPVTEGQSSVDDRGIFLERARELAPLIESEAAAAETAGRLTPKVVQAFRDTGLFWMIVPKAFGGGGLRTGEAIEVIEEISRADGSTGWAFMANAFANGILAGFLPRDGAQELFGGPDKAILAGMGAPVGTARKVDGGYLVKGSYRFGSGSHHTTHMAFGLTLVNDQGEVLDYLQSLVPREQVVFKGGWDVTGLVATGSQDYEIPEQVIEERFVFSVTGGPTQHIAPFTTGPEIGLAAHAGIALGLVKRALQEVAGSSANRARAGYPSPVDQYPVFLSEFAKIEADYQAARAYALETYAKTDEYAARKGRPSPELAARNRQATTWTHEMLERVVSKARLWSGSDAFRNPTVMGRLVRDAGVLTQHLFVDPITFVDAAPALLDSWRNQEA
ncbi:acyl-CoA dehydrogenase family protein [Arthrobacter sp. I2-34]|uniref:Acyl-CoA dehydrogenase family protein n=1 Tax=Arthrobacter hankyongi TaxID=2904801 RepID=A0ABS9L3H6_9MICC|nr:acyl-CoA dehydrogenase family protein [Arthrobacter hankyongi]MCG2621252.1 acyl-CoA dehydrogenase family protein [Arthrobacter hankyongi]